MSEAKRSRKRSNTRQKRLPVFVENYSRASTTEMSRFANPLDLNLEEVLSNRT
jgi:hypothetical protein